MLNINVNVNLKYDNNCLNIKILKKLTFSIRSLRNQQL